MKKILLKLAYSIFRHYKEEPMSKELELGGILRLDNGKKYRIYTIDTTLSGVFGYSDIEVKIRAKEVGSDGRD